MMQTIDFHKELEEARAAVARQRARVEYMKYFVVRANESTHAVLRNRLSSKVITEATVEEVHFVMDQYMTLFHETKDLLGRLDDGRDDEDKVERVWDEWDGGPMNKDPRMTEDLDDEDDEDEEDDEDYAHNVLEEKR